MSRIDLVNFPCLNRSTQSFQSTNQTQDLYGNNAPQPVQVAGTEMLSLPQEPIGVPLNQQHQLNPVEHNLNAAEHVHQQQQQHQQQHQHQQQQHQHQHPNDELESNSLQSHNITYSEAVKLNTDVNQQSDASVNVPTVVDSQPTTAGHPDESVIVPVESSVPMTPKPPQVRKISRFQVSHVLEEHTPEVIYIFIHSYSQSPMIKT